MTDSQRSDQTHLHQSTLDSAKKRLTRLPSTPLKPFPLHISARVHGSKTQLSPANNLKDSLTWP